jgi:hypothetical protein
MGVIKQMIEKVKCYNYMNVVKMFDYDHPDNMDQYEIWLTMLYKNGVRVFEPPKSVGSGRARKKPAKYFKSNQWFDRYMCEQNTWAALKGKTPVKPGYKKYESDIDVGLLWFNEV